MILMTLSTGAAHVTRVSHCAPEKQPTLTLFAGRARMILRRTASLCLGWPSNGCCYMAVQAILCARLANSWQFDYTHGNPMVRVALNTSSQREDDIITPHTWVKVHSKSSTVLLRPNASGAVDDFVPA